MCFAISLSSLKVYDDMASLLVYHGWTKKIKKKKETEKIKKKIEKNKLWKKPVKILKKLIGSVRFGFDFISLKPKKPNRTQTEKNRKKPSQTDLNRFLS